MAGILKVDRVQSDSNLAFQVGASNVAYFNTTGMNLTGGEIIAGGTVLRATSGLIYANNGISFPASQSSSADPNTLDDYEEGTWTPTASRDSTAPTLSYSSRSGSYVKIGRIVIANMAMILGTVSSAGSGNMIVTGLPFVSSEPSYSGQGIIGYNDALTNAVYAPWIQSSTIYFRSGTRSQGNDAGGWASNGYLNLTMIYQTN